MKNVANMPMMSSPRITLEAARPGMRKTRSGMIGLASRCSRATKAASMAIASPPNPSVWADAHPCSEAVTIA